MGKVKLFTSQIQVNFKMGALQARNFKSYKHHVIHCDVCITDSHISPECPPIAGYTGHIPRVRGTEVSLSQRYNTAVRKGLALLREEQQHRNEMEEAALAVHRALQHDSRYTIPAV